ncbi:MAG: DNA repair protein RecN [Gammaproteobacteria bacterium]|nr:MAG: DNA repair protein RecN [Gammaproteobacteria bacterium]
MLRHLAIHDFAVIADVELDLKAGLTVLTGETGAGKSILVDALGLTLGDRASADVVRASAPRAEVTAVFEAEPGSPAHQWLHERELENPEAECVVRRIVGEDGRSRAYINGRPAPVQELRELGDVLVDIHGQHAHQSLLKRPAQRNLLDRYADNQQFLQTLGRISEEWAVLRKQLQQHAASPQERAAQLQQLREEHVELESLGMESGELTQLEDEHRRLSHATELLEAGAGALGALTEDSNSASTQLALAARLLDAQTRHDRGVADLREMLETTGIHLDEATNSLRRYLEDVERDPARLQQVEERLGRIHQLARKHRVQPDELPSVLPELGRSIEALEDSEASAEELAAQRDALLSEYQVVAMTVRKQRQAAAAKMASEIAGVMQELGMPEGRFQIALEYDLLEEPSVHGGDRVEFLVSANPGQGLLPLTRVASGGELSRISLAAHVICAEDADIPTLIFDEVDAGIGGRIGEIVGRHLRRLAENRQVLCITHLAQLASWGQDHVQVDKQAHNGETRTSLARLSTEDRINEIARMMGGVEITAQTLAHAREMLQRAAAA